MTSGQTPDSQDREAGQRMSERFGAEEKTIRLETPISREMVAGLHAGDKVLLSGKIFCGRDAVLPRIAQMAENGELENAPFDLNGGVIFHTAVSIAGVGPTSSNKLEIESTMGILSRAGIRLHLGKGALKKETVQVLQEFSAAYAVIPPVTALLNRYTVSRRVIAFPELGMEALYEVLVKDYPAVIAIANGQSIF